MPRVESPDDASAGVLAVLVVRTGGIAGIRRRWRVDPAPDEEQRWVELIESCPWDEPEPESPLGADRFTWLIQATTRHDERRREIPEPALVGAWRDLVDAVRDAPREDRADHSTNEGQ
ncbi:MULTISPECIES: protealysin inhibitor emfourin [unclassified Microbacterium]|uniref:protealysin inhibitor emfourin n=1 Tax=unclassified Microbacterium TaxID=2609290 RepID=UPI001E4BA604|nr:protealysin inhibitor emfourin [Microbacterium sp. MAH-37]